MASKGFGGSKAEPSKNAMQFILAFKKYVLANPDLKDVREFFSSHLSEIDESLLSSLPLIFRELIKNKKPQEQFQIAVIFGNFGNFIREFPSGDRSLNLEMSISSSQLALKIFTRRDNPKEWAITQNNLGIAYRDRIRGERADNIELAISFFELSLRVYTHRDFPQDWAMTQTKLSHAYCGRIRGERANNIEQAIALCELALQVITHKTYPENWALIQNILGSAYWERILGDRAENLEKSISAYELALQVQDYNDFPKEWAGLQNNLGNAYRERIRGEHTDNIEKAIMAFELALQVNTRDAFPGNWALLQNNLGLAYKDRIQGERTHNLEKAITSFNLALQVRTREANPEYWAMAQHNLAKTYRDRILGERADNLEEAIYLFNQAAQVFTRTSFPEKWSINQAHLAEALMKRSLLNNDFTDLDTAINLLQTALEVAVVGSPDYIDTQYRLGNALSRRYEHTKNPAELEQAVQAYKIALDAISPEHYDRKQIWQALPTTQAILGSRLVKDGEWQEGLQLLLNSLTQLSTGDDPLAHANALYQTARAYEIMSDLDKARLYYRDALRLYDHLNDDLGTTQSRAGLGSVLVSQGHLEKGINELAQAREGYLLLQKVEQAHEVDKIYQAAQRALERQTTEVYS
jgi:tetratricopeptide (TPR) repeat protein